MSCYLSRSADRQAIKIRQNARKRRCLDRMSIAAEKIAERLALPEQDRAYLARQLIASLDDIVDAEIPRNRYTGTPPAGVCTCERVMKKNRYIYGFIITAVLAILCVLPAKYYASTAYNLWLNQDAASAQQVQIDTRYNHFWVTAAVAFGIGAIAFLVAGLRRREERSLDQPA